MEDFEENIRQYRINDNGSWIPASVYIESIPGRSGLAGGNFFTLTYSIVGQALTVFLTFVIVSVQFWIDKEN